MLTSTHQPSQRSQVSIGRVRIKLDLRTIRQVICLLGDSTCQTSWRDQLSFTATDLPCLGILTYPSTCHSSDETIRSTRVLTVGPLVSCHCCTPGFSRHSCRIPIGRRFGVEIVKASWIALESPLTYEYLSTAVAAGFVELCCILS